MMQKWLALVVALAVVTVVAWAQADTWQVITAENVAQLGSVLTIDVAAVADETGEIVNGWLRVNPNGTRIVTLNRANEMLVWELEMGTLQGRYRVPASDTLNANMLDAAWDSSGAVVHSLHTDGLQAIVAVYDVQTDTLTTVAVPIQGDMPVRIWADADPDFTWLEVMTADPRITPYVVRLNITDGTIDQQLDSVAEADSDADVRIGRMPAPLAVTATRTGIARLWNLEDGSLLHEAQVEMMPMFGHINGAAGRRLAWRDPESTALHVLDFTTGADVRFATLDGAYAQALLLTANADAVLGVNLDLAPIVVAWTRDGDEIELGEYRACGRTPDMIQLSDNGTTLVIGCDTGWDIWRIQE